MHLLVLAAAMAATSPPVAPVPEQRVEECTAQRLKRFVGPFGAQQSWPVAAELPAQLQHYAGLVLSEPGVVLDGYRHVLHVEARTNSAYVLQQGGIAGQVVVFGPLPVAACPRVAL